VPFPHLPPSSPSLRGCPSLASSPSPSRPLANLPIAGPNVSSHHQQGAYLPCPCPLPHPLLMQRPEGYELPVSDNMKVLSLSPFPLLPPSSPYPQHHHHRPLSPWPTRPSPVLTPQAIAYEACMCISPLHIAPPFVPISALVSAPAHHPPPLSSRHHVQGASLPTLALPHLLLPSPPHCCHN